MINPDDFLNGLIAANIVRLRKERGWSQTELAAQLNVPQTYISQLETGKRAAGKRTRAKLTRVFGVTEEEFVQMPADYGTPEMREIWSSFHAVIKGEKMDLLKKVLKVIEIAAESGGHPEALKALESQVDLITVTMKKKT